MHFLSSLPPGTAELDLPEVSQYLRTVWLLYRQQSISSPNLMGGRGGRRTPANTLVMSKTRYPDKGRDSSTEAPETNRTPCAGRRGLAQDREALLLSSTEGNLVVVRVNISGHANLPQCPMLFFYGPKRRNRLRAERSRLSYTAGSGGDIAGQRNLECRNPAMSCRGFSTVFTPQLHIYLLSTKARLG